MVANAEGLWQASRRGSPGAIAVLAKDSRMQAVYPCEFFTTYKRVIHLQSAQ